MSNINTVALSGNLTKAPELRATGSGTSVCSLRVAVNERVKGPSGEWTDRANYFDVVVFGGKADACVKFLDKGSPVVVSGRLHWREWEKDGQKRQAVDVIADTVQFVDRSKLSAGKGDDAFEQAKSFVGEFEDEDDVPF